MSPMTPLDVFEDNIADAERLIALTHILLNTRAYRRRFNGHELIADVLDGTVFKDGERITDEDNDDDTIDEKVAA